MSGSLPSVTAVIPTRERPELLMRAARGICSQRYEGPIECVVVFDQSEPHPVEVDPGPGRSVRCIRNEGTPGLAGARNAGSAQATGDYVAHCDDDDVWRPDKLRIQMEALLARPGSAVATTGISVHYGDRVVPRVAPAEVVQMHDLLKDRLTELHPSTFLVRRSELAPERIGPVDESLPGGYAEDYEWLLRASRRAPVVAVRRPLVDVYWHRSSFFAQRWQMIADALTTLLDRYPEFGTEPSGLARVSGQIAFAYAGAGERREARRWVGRTVRADWRQPRAYLALLASLGLVSNATILKMLHTTGRGF
jgi:glycosyltransferase involved in cell wall biosynthesis